MVMARVCGLARFSAARVWGELTFTPCTDAVVRMMNTTSST